MARRRHRVSSAGLHPRPEAGFVISVGCLIVFTVVLLVLIVAAFVFRNALFLKASGEVIKDSDTPPNVIGKPIGWGICEEPQLLCKDPGRGTTPDPAAGMWALVGVRPDRFVTRNAVYYADADCDEAGGVYVAPPAAPAPLGELIPDLPVGYLDGLETVGQMSPLSYAVGAPEGFVFAIQTPTGPGRLYRSADAAISSPLIRSVWTSLAPDCVLESLPGGVAAGPINCPTSGDPGTVASHTKISATVGGPGGGGFPGLGADDRFGGGLAGLGDLDGDGVTDLAITARFDDDGGSNRGAVYIAFMDAGGTVDSVQKISDTAGGFTGTLDDGDSFGRSVVSLGNLTGLTGVLEIAVGVRGDDDGGTDRGAVWILSLDTSGMVVDQQKISSTAGGFGAGLANSDLFGVGIENIGDLDGNGVPDLAVGAPRDDGPGTDRGAVWIVFLNADGTVSGKMQINHPDGGLALDDDDRFGTAIGRFGDLTGDGTIEIAVGAGNDDDGGANRGAVWIVSVDSTGAATAVQKISDTAGGFTGILDDGDEFGNAVAALGDIDGDTVPDLAVGARLDDDGGSNRGAVWVLFLETDGSVKGFQKISDTVGGFTGVLDNEDFFGAELASVGDFNGDGVVDIAVDAILDDDGGANIGAVYLLLLNGVVTPTSCVGPPADLVSWWPGDGDFSDIAGPNLGADGDDVTFVPGRVDQAFDLDGTNDYLSVPGTLLDNVGTAGTIDMWFRFDAASSAQQVLFDKVNGVDNTTPRSDLHRFLGFFPAGNQGRIEFQHRGGETIYRAFYTPADAPPWAVGRWYHAAFVWGPSGTQVYVDGALVASDPAPLSTANANGTEIDLAFGANLYPSPGLPSPRSYLAGSLDEIEYHNTALTACEIQQIYLAGAFGKCKIGEEVFPDMLCENITPRSLSLIRAEEVLVDPSMAGSANLLEGPPYVTPFNIMPPMGTLTAPVPEMDPASPPAGDLLAPDPESSP